MILSTKLEVALGVALALGGLFAWHVVSDSAAQKAATDTEVRLRDAQIKDYQKTIEIQQSALESQQRALATQRAQVPKLDPTELANLVASQIKGAQVQADNTVVLPPAAQQAAATQKFDCDKCALDLKSRDLELDLVNEKLGQVTLERDAYKKELKGGTFWHRVGKTAKDVAIGLAVGEIIHVVLNH